MVTIKSFKDLIVWQRSLDLAVEIYQLSSFFPKEEVFGLTSQIRRASCSITLNIAEGYGRNTTKNYVSSLYIAEGSLREVEAALILALRLGFIQEEKSVIAQNLIVEESKMLNSLISSLEKKISK